MRIEVQLKPLCLLASKLINNEHQRRRLYFFTFTARISQ